MPYALLFAVVDLCMGDTVVQCGGSVLEAVRSPFGCCVSVPRQELWCWRWQGEVLEACWQSGWVVMHTSMEGMSCMLVG